MCGVGGLLAPPFALRRKNVQLPPMRGNIVTQDVEVALRVFHLEVAVIGRQPTVDNFRDVDLALPEAEPPRRLLAHDSQRGTPHPPLGMRVLLVTLLVRFTAREDASVLVSLVVVGRELRAEADVVVKDVEAWVTLLSVKF